MYSNQVEQAFESFDDVVELGVVGIFDDEVYNTQYDITVNSAVSNQNWEQIVATAKHVSDTYNIFVTGSTNNRDDSKNMRHFRFGQETKQ